MLVPDKRDKQNVQAYLTKHDKTWEWACKSKPDWIWKRVKRYIPEKSILYCILEELFNVWGHAKCSKTGQELFNELSWKKANGVLHDVKKG